MKCSESSLKLNSPPAMLCLQDVSDPVTLQSVEAAVRDNKSLKWMRVKTSANVAIAILKGAAKNETLGTVQLLIPDIPDEPFPAPELVDEVRRSNPKLQLTVRAGSRESEHVTVVMTVV